MFTTLKKYFAYNEKNIVYYYHSYCDYRRQGIIVILKRTMKNFVRIFLKQVHVNIPNAASLFLIDFNRSDYKSMFDLIYESCESEKERFSFEYKLQVDFNNIADLVKSLFMWKKIKCIYDVDREVKTTFLSRLYIFSSIIELRKFERALSENGFGDKVKIITVLRDTIPDANVVVNYANSRGLMTVNCQHGIFITSNDDRSIHYLNNWKVPSQITLTWGSYTANYLKRLNPHMKLFVCGNPAIKAVISEQINDSKLIGVVFDIPIYKSYNQEMLRIVEKYAIQNNMRVYVRLHPTDYEKNYSINLKCTKFCKDIDVATCIVGHTTTMIFTYMILGYQVYVFNSDLQKRDVSKDILFSSYDEFCNCFMLNYDFIAEGKKKIAYIGEESKRKYRDFYSKLIRVVSSNL